MSIPPPDDSFVFVDVKPVNLSSNVTDVEVEPRPPEMKSMHIVSNVRNRYARTIVTSKYANPDSRAQEASFSIVLPDTAFIAGFVMEIKGKKYEAYVKEKEEAKQEYQQAISSGRAAAHVAVSARDSNKFTVSVNVEPQSDVTFILTYEELLVRKHSKYEMVVNLHPGQLLDDLGVDININETRSINNVVTPAIRSGNEISDKVTKNKYATIEKDTEGIVHVCFHPTVEQQKEIANALSNGNNSNGISGQFVVEYDVERDPLGGEVLVNDGYFVHFFAPTELKPIPKHVVFVLDVSGSMSGRKIEQLKEAMKIILSELNSEDYFNIIKFASDVQILYSNHSLEEVANTSLPATVENISKAQRVVSSMQAGGGTNISDALITALSVTSKGISLSGENTNIQPIIVFLTDGQANGGECNPTKIIDIVLKRNDTENKSAIFTLAFGNDANKEFLKELAMKNSGFLRNIYEAADASLQLQDFYKQISSPLLRNVNFKYSEEVKEITKHNFDILFNGSEFVVTGKIDKIDDGFVVVEGSTLYGINDFRPTIIPVCPRKEEKEKFGDLERLWAYMTIKQLLDKKYEKNNHNEDTVSSETSEKRALKLALKYSFVTSVTSLVVVKPEDDLQWGSVHVASSNNLFPAQEYGRPRVDSMCMRKLNSACSTGPPSFGRRLKFKRSGFATGALFGSSSISQLPVESLASFSSQTKPKCSFSNAKPSRAPTCISNKPIQSLLARNQQNCQQNSFAALPNLSQNLWNNPFNVETALKNMVPQSPELKCMHVVSNVRNRYARTVVSSKYTNQEMRALQTMFSIILPDSAFITGFVMEINGTKYEANMRNKEQSKKEYQEAVTQGLTAAHVTNNADNPNKLTVSVNIEPQSEVTFILTYEQFLIQKDSKYEIVTNLHPGHTLQDLEVDVKINDSKSITNIETPKFRSKNQIIECVHATIKKNIDGSIHVSFNPTAEQQKEIINILKESEEHNGISGQFVIEYNIEKDSEDAEISVNDVPDAPPVTDFIVVKLN